MDRIRNQRCVAHFDLPNAIETSRIEMHTTIFSPKANVNIRFEQKTPTRCDQIQCMCTSYSYLDSILLHGFSEFCMHCSGWHASCYHFTSMIVF